MHASLAPSERPVTVVVRRVARAGCEAQFERAMREFIDSSANFPGSCEFHVMGPADDDRQFTIVHRFASDEARRRFIASSEYAGWMERLRALTEPHAAMQEFAGLGGWFASPPTADPITRRPCAIKMAVVTFLGVVPLTSTLPPLCQTLLPGAHPLVTNAVATAMIVALLTWPVMPFLTRVFRWWLVPRSASQVEVIHERT